MSNANNSSWLTPFLFACCPPSSSALCVSQTPPSSTNSTARRPRTLRSCARRALTSTLCARTPHRLRRPRPLQRAGLCRPCPRSHTPTLCPTAAPSPVSKACPSPSPLGVRAGLPPRVSPSRSRSRPPCGGSCRGSGTALSWRSLQRTRGVCRRYLD